MLEILSHPIPSVVLLLGILIFVHELGHFLVGKFFGVGVEIFSIGFGPRLFGLRINNTDYRISGVPLGGYVKFAGTLPSEEVGREYSGQELYRADPWKRGLIIVAGPAANLLLAVVCYFALGMAGIEQPSSIIGEVRAGSPAEQAGLISGDHVVRIDQQDIASWSELQKIVSKAVGKRLEIAIIRDGVAMSVNLTPDAVDGEDYLGRVTKIGRAGIGYGSLPAKVSLLDQTSAAAVAGLQTGDLILSMAFGQGVRQVSSWSDVLKALTLAFESRSPELVLEVARGGDGETVAVKMATASWELLRDEVEALAPAQLRRRLSQQIGIADSQLTIAKVEAPADLALKPGDRLIAFNGTDLKDIYHLHDLLSSNQKDTVSLRLVRADAIVDADVVLKGIDVQKPSGRETVFALAASFVGAAVEPPPHIERYENPLAALAYGVATTLEQSWMIVTTIGGLFTGDVPLKALGGPMLIAKVAGDSVKMGWQAVLTSLALISINLGMINLFPIPVLDGGQLIMTAIEGVRRRRLSESTVENYQKIGFVMIMSLVVLATYNDLSRFWQSMVQGIAGLF